MKISHNSLLKSGLLNSLPCMIDSPNRIQRTRRFHTVFFSVPSVPFVVPWCSTRDSRLAAKPIIDAAQDSRKLLRFQRLSLTSCHSWLFLVSYQRSPAISESSGPAKHCSFLQRAGLYPRHMNSKSSVPSAK